jgi:hypothetical protein
MIEAAADLLRDSRLGHHLRPPQQQIVIVEDVLLMLGLDVAGEQSLQLIGPSRTPWIVLSEHRLDRRLRVHAAGIDRKTGALGGKTALGLGKSELVAHQVKQISRILAIVDGEGRIEADAFSVFPQQPRPDAVKGSRPGQRIRHDVGLIAEDATRDALDTLCHLRGRAAGKRHQQHAARVGALDDQVGNPVRERVGLSGSCAGYDKQRRADGALRGDAMLDGPALLSIETFQILISICCEHESPHVGPRIDRFERARNEGDE